MLVETMKTDVLIIGGGSAGSMAAIRAKEINPKQRVTIFEKSDIKYGGSIPRGMDALNILKIHKECLLMGGTRDGRLLRVFG
ncbi:MAG: NAD(P)/FAD-dependent oxidoreductase [Bacillota bacterium]